MNYCLKYLHAALNINLENQFLIEFIQNYFTPYFSFEQGSCNNALYTISVEVKDLGSDSERKFTGEKFVVDGSKEFLSTFGQKYRTGKNIHFRLLPMNVFINYNYENRHIYISGNCQERIMVPLLRIIEDLTFIEIEKSGGVVIHASGIVSNDRAALAIGNKGAGKTSVLSYFLNDFICSKLCNDNVVLFIRDGKIFARGWPAFYKIEIGTIASMEKLAGFFPHEKRDCILSSKTLWEESKKTKLAFYPHQGARLFMSGIIPEAELKVILAPRYDSGRVSIKRIYDFDIIMKILKENLQGSFNQKHPNWHMINKVNKDDILISFQQILSLLKRQVEFYSMLWSKSLSQLLSEIDMVRLQKKTYDKAMNTTGRRKESLYPIPPVF